MYTFYEQTPGHVIPPKRLTDAEYAAAIARFPRLCADVIPIDHSRKVIYLTRRRLGHPSGWWWIGGGLNAGERPEYAALRNLHRETSLKFLPSRLRYIRLNMYLWSERDYEPRELGSHDVVFCYTAEFTSGELALASANLDPSEYLADAGFEVFDRPRIQTASGFNEMARRAILDLYDEIFKE